MNSFGHLSCLVKEIRKPSVFCWNTGSVPAGNLLETKSVLKWGALSWSQRCLDPRSLGIPHTGSLGHCPGHWCVRIFLACSVGTNPVCLDPWCHPRLLSSWGIQHDSDRGAGQGLWDPISWMEFKLLEAVLTTLSLWPVSFPFPSTRLAAVPLASYHDPWLTSSCLIASDSQLIPQISKWWPGPVEQEKRESPQCNQDQLRYFQGLAQNENVGSLFKRQEKVPLKTLKYSVFLSLRSSSVQTHACYSIRPHLTDSRSKIKRIKNFKTGMKSMNDTKGSASGACAATRATSSWIRLWAQGHPVRLVWSESGRWWWSGGRSSQSQDSVKTTPSSFWQCFLLGGAPRRFTYRLLPCPSPLWKKSHGNVHSWSFSNHGKDLTIRKTANISWELSMCWSHIPMVICVFLSC